MPKYQALILHNPKCKTPEAPGGKCVCDAGELKARQNAPPYLNALVQSQMWREARASVALDMDSELHTCYQGHCQPKVADD